MSISVVEDIKSVSEFKKRTREVFQQLHRTGRPIVVTVNGRPDAILLDVAVFEKKLKALNLSGLLSEGEADVRAGRTRPARDFLKALRRGKKVPR
jgi:prevent-host-death family protein